MSTPCLPQSLLLLARLVRAAMVGTLLDLLVARPKVRVYRDFLILRVLLSVLVASAKLASFCFFLLLQRVASPYYYFIHPIPDTSVLSLQHVGPLHILSSRLKRAHPSLLALQSATLHHHLLL